MIKSGSSRREEEESRMMQGFEWDPDQGPDPDRVARPRSQLEPHQRNTGTNLDPDRVARRPGSPMTHSETPRSVGETGSERSSLTTPRLRSQLEPDQRNTGTNLDPDRVARRPGSPMTHSETPRSVGETGSEESQIMQHFEWEPDQRPISDRSSARPWSPIMTYSDTPRSMERNCSERSSLTTPRPRSQLEPDQRNTGTNLDPERVARRPRSPMTHSETPRRPAEGNSKRSLLQSPGQGFEREPNVTNGRSRLPMRVPEGTETDPRSRFPMPTASKYQKSMLIQL